MTSQRILRAVFCAILLGLNAGFACAQTVNFSQTGQIRPVVSETETEIPSWKGTVHDAGFKFSGAARAKVDFYFVYRVFENGIPTEKWIALSDQKNWGQFSNQIVRLTGSFENDKLSNAAVAPLTSMSKEYLTNPPPTEGLYKIVAVPLTIQPQSARKNPDREAALGVTPEAIRETLFNAPNSVNNFYREASYGRFGFGGVIHPQVDVVPVTIQATISTNCQEQIVNQFTPIVRQRLLEQNIDTTNGGVDLGLIIYNDTPGCPPFPFATRGALGQRGVPLWVWMPESWFATGPVIVSHEIGHALGGNHPSVLRCEDFNNPQTCVAADAADRDIMTSAGRFYMLPNNYERRRWGWHPPGAFDNPSNGALDLFDLHSPALTFARSGIKQGRFFYRNLSGIYGGWDIYPEGRRNWGLFERYGETDEEFRLGIAVRIGHSNYGDPEAIPLLLDPNDTEQSEDAPLRANQEVSIGGALIRCIREHHPGWGTRMKIQ